MLTVLCYNSKVIFYFVGECIVKKFKRISGVVCMSVIVSLLLSGCNILEQFGLEESKKYIAIESKPIIVGEYRETKLDYGYSTLENNAQKNLYTSIEKAVWNISDTIGENGLYAVDEIFLENVKMTKKDIVITIEAFNCDNPEIFWLSYSFGYNVQGESTYVYMYSQYSSEKVKSMQKEIDTAVDDFFSDIPAELSEYDREIFIHDKLLNSCVYADGVSTTDDNSTAFSIYGALIDNTAVCEGYSKSMQYLLRLVGIKSMSVNGYSKNSLHEWCMVNIDDNWYHLDATWNDKDGAEGESGTVMHTYFNASDSFISADHTIAKNYSELTDEDISGSENESAQLFNLPLPECTTDILSYYNIEGGVLTSFDSYDSYSKIVDNLYNVALKKADCFYLKIDDKLDFSKTTDKLFYSEPYQFFEYTDDVNGMMNTDYKISDSLSVTTFQEQSLVVINLAYDKK